MPRPAKMPDNRRIASVTVRLTTAQREKIRTAAQAAGIQTMSRYLSRLIDGEAPAVLHPAGDAGLAPYELVAQWQRAGNNINQIARALNRGRDAELDWLLDTLRSILALMIQDQITRRYALKHGLARTHRRTGARK